jgi:hypothetical protein
LKLITYLEEIENNNFFYALNKEIDLFTSDLSNLEGSVSDVFLKDWKNKIDSIKNKIKNKDLNNIEEDIQEIKKSFNDNWIIPHQTTEKLLNIKNSKLNHILLMISNYKKLLDSFIFKKLELN